MRGFPASMRVLERGWLSANNVLFADADGATLVDSGHVAHREQTEALVRHALADHRVPTLRRVVNTHLHSDHCGANAHLARATGCAIAIPAGYADAVRRWDVARLSFDLLEQRSERFDADETIAAGDTLTMGGLAWDALAAPGHDGDSLMFHCADLGILISGDALWEEGSGAMFPSEDPTQLARDFAAAFDTLDRIDALDLRVVVPGHGAPFTDAKGAVARARSRLERLADDPARNARHVIRTLVKFRLLDERRIPLASVHAMLDDVATLRFARRDLPGPRDALAARVIDELVAKGAAAIDGDALVDR